MFFQAKAFNDLDASLLGLLPSVPCKPVAGSLPAFLRKEYRPSRLAATLSFWTPFVSRDSQTEL